MFKKLGKKQLLGVLTAAAITVTTVGSFAVWDTLSANTAGSLTLDKPITVSASGGATFAAGSRTLGNENTYTAGDVTFNVENNVEKTQLTLEPKITIGTSETPTDVTDQFDIVISENSTPVANNIDTTLEATNTYSVAITPKADANTAVTDAAKGGNALNVSITGTLSATPAS